MKSHLIKVYHGFSKWRSSLVKFLNDISKTLEEQPFTLWFHSVKGELFYSLSCENRVYPSFESQFYTNFDEFQVMPDTKNKLSIDPKKSAIASLWLQNNWFFPFQTSKTDSSDFIFNMFRTVENFNVITDKVGLYVEIMPIRSESTKFYIWASLKYFFFKIKLMLGFYKYMFNFKIKKDRKLEWDTNFRKKLDENLFQTRMMLVVQSGSQAEAKNKLEALFTNFQVFKNYPLNQFTITTSTIEQFSIWRTIKKSTAYAMSADEISSFMHFPKDPGNETSLLTVKAKKLTLPIWVPTYEYTLNSSWEVLAWEHPRDVTVLGISDYRSIKVPVGLYDEDRLRHVYVVGKTWVWKSKFLQSLMISDIHKWKWIGVIDPHGDLVEEIMTHIPESRKNDVVIFDPTDEKFPFCLNPLDVSENESKQVLAKGFIDIFKKFFGSNWNAKLEHVLRMIFLALLDKPNATLYDIIRALTDKDFRYDMIDAIEDDVVRNFWTNEFAWRSQQFNTEAIMPILNKVWQLLSIEILKNIFASSENKLDFRKVMDDQKILLIKLPKGKLQEEIMGFLGAMFVTKLYQTAMWRQSVAKKDRTPFFLYVDEFQNFATETFNEILSEARKYGLSLAVAHQFIKQIPANISDALFGNVWTLISFRISSEDSEYMKKHFAPFLGTYDLANLNMREMYCKILVKWQVKDPFSLRSAYTPDAEIKHDYIDELYELSRAKYSRTLQDAKKAVEEQKEVMEVIEEFAEPLI